MPARPLQPRLERLPASVYLAKLGLRATLAAVCYVKRRMAVLRLHATGIVGPLAGSSRPLLVDTASARFVVKLVGAPEGSLALAAEYLCSELAGVAGVPVLQHAQVELDPALATTIAEDELREAVARGAGRCFGLRELPGAAPLPARRFDAVSDDFALPLLWFDVLVQNPDRRRNNPNVLALGAALFAIDHGSCLPFHHNFDVTEATPTAELAPAPEHVFADRAPRLNECHAALSARFTLARLEQICSTLPVEWLGRIRFDTADRQRRAYAAYLWKRLRAMSSAFPS